MGPDRGIAARGCHRGTSSQHSHHQRSRRQRPQQRRKSSRTVYWAHQAASPARARFDVSELTLALVFSVTV
jgi:hypothetical protein